MGIQQDGSLPQGFDLGTNFQLVFAAVDPLTGDPVSGVVVRGAQIVASQIEGTVAGLATPLWLPLPLSDQSDDS